MLVLSRKTGQTILIGPDVIVAVLGISGNRVYLGVTAPPEVAIHRGEWRARIDRQRSSEAVSLPAPSYRSLNVEVRPSLLFDLPDSEIQNPNREKTLNDCSAFTHPKG